MLRLFFDHDINYDIIKGLIKKIPNLDFTTPNKLGNSDETDENHLAWAWENKRVIVSHDVNTMTDAAKQRLKNGESIFGLILVSQSMPIGDVINELELIIQISEENDFENSVEWLPYF